MTSYNQKLRLNKTFTEIPPFRHLQIGSRGRVFALWMDRQPTIMTITIALQLHHMARGRREKTIWVILRYWILSLKMTFAQNLPELLWMTKYKNAIKSLFNIVDLGVRTTRSLHFTYLHFQWWDDQAFASNNAVMPSALVGVENRSL